MSMVSLSSKLQLGQQRRSVVSSSTTHHNKKWRSRRRGRVQTFVVTLAGILFLVVMVACFVVGLWNTTSKERTLVISSPDQEKEGVAAPFKEHADTRKGDYSSSRIGSGSGTSRRKTADASASTGKLQQRKIVDTSLWAKPSKDYKVDKNDLWENLEELPKWLINYFRFHKEHTTNSVDWKQQQQQSNSNTSSQLPANVQYMYVTCLETYRKCGGTADRLLSLPFLIKVAASTNRVLLFQWTRPAPLEEFLVPPDFGMDWRVPESKVQQLQELGQRAGTQDTIMEMAPNTNIQVLQVKFQSHDHGSLYYDSTAESHDEPDFIHIFHKLWKFCFVPTPALENQIQETFDKLQLVSGQYTAAHVRALYNTKTRPNNLVTQWTRNSIMCSLQLQQQQSSSTSVADKLPSQQQQQQALPLPVYFASDSVYAIQQAALFGRQHRSLRIVSRNYIGGEQAERADNPLHLDKTKNWKSRPATDFYETFIDLYLLARSKCISYGMGGFGLFASYISNDPDCSLVHMTAIRQEECSIPKEFL